MYSCTVINHTCMLYIAFGLYMTIFPPCLISSCPNCVRIYCMHESHWQADMHFLSVGAYWPIKMSLILKVPRESVKQISPNGGNHRFDTAQSQGECQHDNLIIASPLAYFWVYFLSYFNKNENNLIHYYISIVCLSVTSWYKCFWMWKEAVQFFWPKCEREQAHEKHVVSYLV